MHGLIFETSIWLLAGSTRYLAYVLLTQVQCATHHTRTFKQELRFNFFQFRVNCTGAVRQLNRLSNIRLFKLRQSHENKSHGDWSPPRNYTLFQLDRLNASVLTYRDTLLPCAVLCWCFTTPLLRSHSQAVQAEKRTSLTVFCTQRSRRSRARTERTRLHHTATTYWLCSFFSLLPHINLGKGIIWKC